MKKRDLRSEQAKLLRFEKLIEQTCREKVSGKPLNKAAILTGLPLVAAAAASASAKLGAEAPIQYLAQLQAAATASGLSDEAWLIQLAEVVSKGHNAIEQLADRGAFLLFQASGTPKDPPQEIVKSLLTNGLL